MIERDGGNLLQAQPPRSEHPAVARQHAALLVDEDRDVEPEGRNAVGDAGDLPGGSTRPFLLSGVRASRGSQRT
jgi:hypothetical protein